MRFRLTFSLSILLVLKRMRKRLKELLKIMKIEFAVSREKYIYCALSFIFLDFKGDLSCFFMQVAAL